MYQLLPSGASMSLKNDKSQTTGSMPLQRKTTLKWRDDGELSAIDMARVIDRLNNSELISCDFACDLDSR